MPPPSRICQWNPRSCSTRRRDRSRGSARKSLLAPTRRTLDAGEIVTLNSGPANSKNCRCLSSLRSGAASENVSSLPGYARVLGYRSLSSSRTRGGRFLSAPAAAPDSTKHRPKLRGVGRGRMRVSAIWPTKTKSQRTSRRLPFRSAGSTFWSKTRPGSGRPTMRRAGPSASTST